METTNNIIERQQAEIDALNGKLIEKDAEIARLTDVIEQRHAAVAGLHMESAAREVGAPARSASVQGEARLVDSPEWYKSSPASPVPLPDLKDDPPFERKGALVSNSTAAEGQWMGEDATPLLLGVLHDLKNEQRAEWDIYKTRIMPWSYRLPANSDMDAIANAMQSELNDLRAHIAAAPLPLPAQQGEPTEQISLIDSIYDGLREIIGCSRDVNVLHVANDLQDEIDAAREVEAAAVSSLPVVPSGELWLNLQRRVSDVLEGLEGMDSAGKLSGAMPTRAFKLRAALNEALAATPVPQANPNDERWAALVKINEIRNSIIALQSINWSEHIYPLVAALDEAGFEGMPYPEARKYFGSMLERAVKAEDELVALKAAENIPQAAPGEVQDAVQVIASRLVKLGVTNFKFTRGEDSTATPEQIASAISAALDEIESGGAETPKEGA